MEDVRAGRMLVVGWVLYLASIILNFIFYKIHPSSPEMWTWGAEEELEEWTPLPESGQIPSGNTEEKLEKREEGEGELKFKFLLVCNFLLL